jgi:hypothetical protein
MQRWKRQISPYGIRRLETHYTDDVIRSGTIVPRPTNTGDIFQALTRGWMSFLLVVAAYGIVATWNIALPGVYMDAVNPDYLTVKILNPHHKHIIAWVLDGNYLLGNRFPILIQLYHGSQTFWLGLPLFWIFGTTVEGLRLAHAFLALGVLAALFYMLRRMQFGSFTAAAICAALAVDPSFSYAFRTQSYITLAPSAWLLLSIGLTSGPHAPSSRRWIWSGILSGLAASAYFVQGFFLVAVVSAVWITTYRSHETRWKARSRWLFGLVIGLSPYILGYILLTRSVGGPLALFGFLNRQQAELGAFSSNISLIERVAFEWFMLTGVIGNAWHHSMMFGEWTSLPLSSLKFTILLALPTLLWVIAEVRCVSSPAGRVVAGLIGAFLAVALVFGDRLGGHHYVILLPWLYAWLALGIRDASKGVDLHPSRPQRFLIPGMVAAVLGINLIGQVAEARTLVQTGGVGLMSDAINRFAADLNAMPNKPLIFFPDWGLAFPTVFLTRGTVAMEDTERFDYARQRLCEGQDVEVALIRNPDIRRDKWTRLLGWDEPEVKHYRQRDGKIVFDRIRYHAGAIGQNCTSLRPPVHE